MRENVAVPERVSGYLHRPELMRSILPTSRRVTVLKAPGGFGKTTLLAALCRDLKREGVLTAWLTLDVPNAPQVLDTYLAFAFGEAGLEVLDRLDAYALRREAPAHRTALIVRAIERRGTPCVLVLDELERLDDSASLALLAYLLRWSPPNLHLAIACRALPGALDVASLVLSGHAAVWSVDDLRFSKADVARFFGQRLSRREVAAIARASSGWPIALRILQNERNSGVPGKDGDAVDIAENWIEARMWRGLTERDRQLLLDVGLFEWADAALLDAALDAFDVKRRVEAMPAVSGLLESAPGTTSDGWRLHPLIREHCAKQRLRENPERFRFVHRRIAQALEKRGETIPAMRHATEAGDAERVAAIFRRAGGLHLWLREGVERLQAADRYLTAEIMDAHPDLALAHCAVLAMSGQLAEARRTYRDMDAKLSASERRSAPDQAFELDDSSVRGLLALYGCDAVGSETMRTLMAERVRYCDRPDIDPSTRVNYELGLCIYHNLKAEFDVARDRAARTKRCAPGNPYIEMLVDVQLGQLAMAQGRVSEAATRYTSALRTAKARFLRDPGAVTFTSALLRELDLERDRIAGIGEVDDRPQALLRIGTPFASYAAALGVAVDLTWQRSGAGDALAMVEEVRDHARRVDLPALLRYLAALRVTLLVTQGRLDDAETAWRVDDLPESAPRCLDLRNQSWRELEVLACARLRLYTARRDYRAGRRFARSLVAMATGRGLRRTGMRALALWMVLERSAGAPAEAEDCLRVFLEFYAETDYSRPLVRARDACLPMLTEWIDRNADSAMLKGALRLRRVLVDADDPDAAAPQLSARELDVLQRLGAQRDWEIAEALELSKGGVRYHVANLFEKLGVRGRRNAVRRAQDIGLLPDV